MYEYSKIGYIYKITNKINEKVYIGQTIQEPSVRFAAHIWKANNDICKNSIHKAIAKYGLNNFVFESIAVYPIDCLDNKEIEFIALYDSKNKGYNETYGGNGSKGRIVSDNTRSKISDANKGCKRSEEFKKQRGEYMSNNNPMSGRTHSKESIEKIIDANRKYFETNDPYWKGKNLPKDICKKISEARKVKHIEPWNKGIARTNTEKLAISQAVIIGVQKKLKLFDKIDDIIKLTPKGQKQKFYICKCSNCGQEKIVRKDRYRTLMQCTC